MRIIHTMCVLPFVMLTGCFSCFGHMDPEDFDTELSTRRQEAADDSFCCFHHRVAGECNGGRIVFLDEVAIDAGFTLFFDADSGQFLGKKDRGAYCGSTSLVALQCQAGVITEVFAGPYEVGDAFSP